MKWLRKLLRSWLLDEEPTRPRTAGFFSTDLQIPSRIKPGEWLKSLADRAFQKTYKNMALVRVVAATDSVDDGTEVATLDAADLNLDGLKSVYQLDSYGMSDVQANYYAAQSFIGYQMCAILVQHWLIDKACTMPARDATRNGYTITVNDGTEVGPDVLDYMRKLDRTFKVKAHSREFIRNSRVFGIRIALFVIESEDPDYYTKPFNPDGITPGSYKGISQVDPYWITPELDRAAAADPSNIHFYEPTYWRINGKRYHRSHLVIIKTCEVPDVLKPTYLYGGVPLPQRIYERVYAAERTANEAPQLALTKRSTILHADMDAVVGNEAAFIEKMETWTNFRDNFGVKIVGLQENIEQFDTSLSDFDNLTMTQFQLVCAIAETPATKMLGTTPKGFNSTGEYEEANYHEMLESINEHDVRPLVERHHLCMMRSWVAPKFGIKPFETTIVFEELDAETAKEQADRELVESTTAKNYSDTGAVDGIDIRRKLIANKNSGWNGMEEAIPEGPRPATVVDPGAQKTAPNAPTPAEQQTPAASGQDPAK